jgi:hypothetical protein
MLLHAFDIAAFESDYAKSIPKHDKLTIPANGNGIRAEKGLGCTVLDQVSSTLNVLNIDSSSAEFFRRSYKARPSIFAHLHKFSFDICAQDAPLSQFQDLRLEEQVDPFGSVNAMPNTQDVVPSKIGKMLEPVDLGNTAINMALDSLSGLRWIQQGPLHTILAPPTDDPEQITVVPGIGNQELEREEFSEWLDMEVANIRRSAGQTENAKSSYYVDELILENSVVSKPQNYCTLALLMLKKANLSTFSITSNTHNCSDNSVFADSQRAMHRDDIQSLLDTTAVDMIESTDETNESLCFESMRNAWDSCISNLLSPSSDGILQERQLKAIYGCVENEDDEGYLILEPCWVARYSGLAVSELPLLSLSKIPMVRSPLVFHYGQGQGGENQVSLIVDNILDSALESKYLPSSAACTGTSTLNEDTLMTGQLKRHLTRSLAPLQKRISIVESTKVSYRCMTSVILQADSNLTAPAEVQPVTMKEHLDALFPGDILEVSSRIGTAHSDDTESDLDINFNQAGDNERSFIMRQESANTFDVPRDCSSESSTSCNLKATHLPTQLLQQIAVASNHHPVQSQAILSLKETEGSQQSCDNKENLSLCANKASDSNDISSLLDSALNGICEAVINKDNIPKRKASAAYNSASFKSDRSPLNKVDAYLQQQRLHNQESVQVGQRSSRNAVELTLPPTISVQNTSANENASSEQVMQQGTKIYSDCAHNEQQVPTHSALKSLQTQQSIKIIVSENDFDWQASVIHEVRKKHNIHCIDLPLEFPVTYAIDFVTCICLFRAEELTSGGDSLKTFIKELSRQALKWEIIWVVSIQNGGIHIQASNELTLQLFKTLSRFPATIAYRSLNSLNQLATLISTACNFASIKSASKNACLNTQFASRDFLSDSFANLVDGDENQEMLKRLFSIQVQFLESFPCINSFQALYLLNNYGSLKQLVSSVDPISTVSQSETNNANCCENQLQQFSRIVNIHIGLHDQCR